nr:ELAV-like-1 [Pleurobrachia bachei]
MADQLTVDQRKCLMINYLPASVDKDQFKEMFSEFGAMESCHLVMNFATNESKGYGFIKYIDEESSQKAIDKYNRVKMEGKTLRVAYSTPLDGSKVYTKTVVDDVNVYIAGIPKQWKEPDLGELFSQHGPLKHVKILRESSGESRGAGFVKYGTSKEASAAILNLDGKVPEGGTLPLIVKIADSGKKADSGLQLKTKVGGGGVVSYHDQRFSPYAKTSSTAAAAAAAPIPASAPPPAQANPYGHPGSYPPANAGYGAYPPPAGPPHDYTRSAPAHGGHPPPAGYGSMYGASYPHPAPPVAAPAPAPPPASGAAAATPGSFCLYVANLPETSCKNCLLYQLFAPFGAITSVKAMNNVKSESTDHWFGFVNFNIYGDAANAVHAMNGSTLNGRTLRVDFKSEKKK